MNAVIFDGSPDDDEGCAGMCAQVEAALQEMGYYPKTLQFRKMRMGKCTGCFGCWVRTPGQCVINDDGRFIAKSIVGTDLLVFFTPVTFGGYSSALKVGLDRMIPVLLPTLKNVGGETHHPLRYDVAYPFLLGVGLIQEPDKGKEEIFAQLVGRNGRNMQGRGSASVILHREDGGESVKSKIHAALKNGGLSS
jgi:multimeric flavodoxin WrbA